MAFIVALVACVLATANGQLDILGEVPGLDLVSGLSGGLTGKLTKLGKCDILPDLNLERQLICEQTCGCVCSSKEKATCLNLCLLELVDDLPLVCVATSALKDILGGTGLVTECTKPASKKYCQNKCSCCTVSGLLSQVGAFKRSLLGGTGDLLGGDLLDLDILEGLTGNLLGGVLPLDAITGLVEQVTGSLGDVSGLAGSALGSITGITDKLGGLSGGVTGLFESEEDCVAGCESNLVLKLGKLACVGI